MMNVSRYNASGATHNNGIGATSVVIELVTPDRRLDGMKASNTQRQAGPGIRVSSGSEGAATATAGFDQIISTHSPARATRPR